MADIKTILDQVKNIGNPETHKDGTNKKRAAVAGGAIGLVVGTMIGYSRKWNMFYSIIGGVIVFGTLGYIIAPKD